MVVTSGVRRNGGATKFVAWNTSAGPTTHSAGGKGTRSHKRCSARKGSRTWWLVVPGIAGARPDARSEAVGSTTSGASGRPTRAVTRWRT